MVLEHVTIDARFCGPPDTGNGGYVAGRLARHLEGPVEVTLRAPAPIGVPLEIVRRDDGVLVLRDRETLVATARSAELEIDVPAPPSFEEAVASAGTCRALETHPFPRDFACGPERAPGDGLRIFPGVVAGRAGVAAPWIPDTSLADEGDAIGREFVWAALDTTSSFPLLEDPSARRLEPMVLGRLRLDLRALPGIGDHCVAIAWALGLEGRRGESGAALFGDGDCLATALATWISLNR
jgi:hypothetical protein